MWIVSLFCGILLIICAYKSHDDWRGNNSGISAAISGVLLLAFMYIMNISAPLTIADRIIQIVAVIISFLVLCSDYSYYYCNISTAILTLALALFSAASIVGFFDELLVKSALEADNAETSNEIAQVENVKRGIEWDYENPEINIVEYSIMGVSGKELIVTVTYDGQTSLRTLPLNDVKVEFSDSVLTPYVYRKNYIYTEYNYRKNPPEVLRKDSEHWSDYILCGTKSQIQALFGYEENFNFEQ